MCPNPYHGTKLILNLLLPTHTLLCAIIQTKYSTMAFVQWTVSPSTADPKPLYLDPEICPNFYPDPSFLTHCQFWRKKKNYYVFFSSISSFFYKIYENNDTWRKFSIKIVNFCPSVRQSNLFPLFLTVRIRIRIRNKDPQSCWIRIHNLCHHLSLIALRAWILRMYSSVSKSSILVWNNQ